MVAKIYNTAKRLAVMLYPFDIGDKLCVQRLKKQASSLYYLQQ